VDSSDVADYKMTMVRGASDSSTVNALLSWREVAVQVIKALLKDPAALKRFWIMDPSEERYVRPRREYELPEYRDGMKYRCTEVLSRVFAQTLQGAPSGRTGEPHSARTSS
jgi:hypothetical protein